MTAGRVEARMTVPAGGAAVSAMTGAQASPTTVTVPAGNYYLTQAGGVSSLLTALQTQLNENVQGYPRTAVAMGHAVGYGSWTHGWLFNEASGNLLPEFGGLTLNATSLTYGTAGPRGGIDKAIGFDDGATDLASGGDVFDADTDLMIAWVGYNPVSTSVDRDWINKYNATANSYYLWRTNLGHVAFNIFDGATTLGTGGLTIPAGEWHVGIVALERATNMMRMAVRGLTSGTTVVGSLVSIATVGAVGNAASFRVGGGAVGLADTEMKFAALYVGTGTGAATGLTANLSAAIQQFANAINAAWSVTLGSDGRVAFANSFWPSAVSFTNTTLRDAIGFEYDFDYPKTPTQMRTALGDRGTWTDGVGYLLNEAAGNALSVFGAPATLTANGTPTYNNQGARGGTDKAIGFDAAATEYFDGGNTRDIGASDDLLVVAVWKWHGYPSAYGSVVSKASAAFGNGWAILTMSDPWVAMFTGAGSANQVYAATNNTAFYKGQYCAVIGTVDRSTGRQRIGVINLATGATSISSELVVAGSFSNAAAFRLGKSDWINAPTDVQLSAVYVATGVGVATGISANMAAALASFRSYMLGQTGTQQARGLFYPDCFLDMVGDPKRAPTVSDLRQSMSPTGQVLGIVGNTFKRHRSVGWSHVPAAQVWDAEATYENASWEEFFIETQMGLGSSWFTPSSPIQIYDHNNVQVGVDANVAGWYIVGLVSVEPNKSAAPWCGQWRIEIPQLIAVGS